MGCDAFKFMRINLIVSGYREQDFETIAVRFLDMDSVEARSHIAEIGIPVLLQQVCDDERNVLRCRDEIRKLRYIEVDVARCEELEDLFFDERIELGDGQDQACEGVYFTGGGDFENVVMSVSERVVALAVELRIFSGIQFGRMQAMRCREAIAACESGHAARSSRVLAETFSRTTSTYRSGVSKSVTLASDA